MANKSPAPKPEMGAQQTPSFSPLYQQIKALLVERLHQGEWKPTEAIPSEFELAARFKVSQGTVRKAIDELAAENLLVRRQGKGTYVATHTERQAQYRFLRLVPDAGDQESQGAAQRQVLLCEVQKANAEVANALNLKTGAAIVHARRLLSFAKVPCILEDMWLPASHFQALTAQQLLEYPGSSYALFETVFGVRMVQASEKLKATAATPELSKLLNLPKAAPLLQVQRVAQTYKNQPMELRVSWYNTAAHHYGNVLS